MAWDLAFHTVALAVVDPDFAKQQLDLMPTAHYLHPSGQVPAYEWNFSDVNPPVHAWATLILTRTEQARRLGGAQPAPLRLRVVHTLATVGYGDVTPATPIAGTLAWLEAVTGQLYLAIRSPGSWRCRWPRGAAPTPPRGAERP